LNEVQGREISLVRKRYTFSFSLSIEGGKIMWWSICKIAIFLAIIIYLIVNRKNED